MPHPIVEIDELVRLVVDALVETSPRSAVLFALTCRSLEELTLSSLWKEQHSLTDLIKVLPNHTWVQDEHGVESIVSGRHFSVDCIRCKSPRRSSTTLHRRTGPGCDDTLPGCVGYNTSVVPEEFSAAPFPDCHAIPRRGIIPQVGMVALGRRWNIYYLNLLPPFYLPPSKTRRHLLFWYVRRSTRSVGRPRPDYLSITDFA